MFIPEVWAHAVYPRLDSWWGPLRGRGKGAKDGTSMEIDSPLHPVISFL